MRAMERPGRLPPMGWNSWNSLGPDVTEDQVLGNARALVETGLRDAGYRCVVVDDYWPARERSAEGRLVAHPQRFPSGMAELGRRLHEMGLLFGIYSDAAELTCGKNPGSLGHEEQDARDFADWGVDFLKYDFCHAPTDREEAFRRYRRMADALEATGRPILFSICEWGACSGYEWARAAGGHMWRTTLDLVEYWDYPRKHTNRGNSILTVLDLQEGLAGYAGPFGHNDMDMLLVGLNGRGALASGLRFRELAAGCTLEEYRTHMALWCMMSSPLMASCDLASADADTLSILGNPDLLAIDQDPLCRPARRVLRGDGYDVYWKDMADGRPAVACLNRTDRMLRMKPPFAALSDLTAACRLHDAWTHEIAGTTADTERILVEPHGCRVFRLEPLET